MEKSDGIDNMTNVRMLSDDLELIQVSFKGLCGTCADGIAGRKSLIEEHQKLIDGLYILHYHLMRFMLFDLQKLNES